MNPTDKTPFRDLLRQYRLAAGLTQEDLAHRARLSTRAISDLERGARTRPWPETVALIADALTLEPADRARLDAAARPAISLTAGPVVRSSEIHHSTPRDNLPISVTSFVGRERDVAEVNRLLETTRLLTLTGAGGCGKTRLALRVAADLVEQYSDGIWLVELAPLADPSLVPGTVATVLGVREGADQPILATLHAFLRARHLLLILDNCEHLVDACAHLADGILRGGLGTQILATSREALGIGGEVIWRVPSLADNEAMRLFLDRAVAVRPAFALTEQNGPILARICGRLDGIPLAIELAARRVNSLSIDQIAARLDQRFSLLTGGSRTSLPRQQTLAALVGWSYDLLSGEEKRLFERLSVFAGGFTLEAAEVLGAGNWDLGGKISNAGLGPSGTEYSVPSTSIIDLLTSLVDKSLVVADDEAGNVERYRMLETLRAYGRERLVASGEAVEAWERHAAYYLELVEDCVRLYTSEGAASHNPFVRLMLEQANLRSALTWYEENDLARGLRLAAGLGWHWIRENEFAEGIGWLDAFLARKLGDPGVRGRALLALATLKRDRGEYVAAQPLFEEALDLCRSVGDAWGIARSLIMLAYQERSAANYDGARALGEEGLALARKIKVDESIVFGLAAVSQFYRLTGDFGRARAYLEENLQHSPNERFGFNQHHPLLSLGLIAMDAKEYDRAIGLFQEGLNEWSSVPNPRYNWWRFYLSRAFRKKGDNVRARQLLEDDLVMARQTRSDHRIPRILFDLAEIQWAASESASALSRLAEGLGLSQRDGIRDYIAIGLLIGARRVVETGALIRGARLFGAADSTVPGFRFQTTTVDMADYERILGELRAALDQDAFNQAWAEGHAMPIEDAIALALVAVD